MKRIRVHVATALLAAMIIGCEGGLAEGPPKDAIPPSGQTDAFKDEMKRMGEKMQMKNQMKARAAAAKAGTKPTDKPADKTDESK
jgi:hypothetical protein